MSRLGWQLNCHPWGDSANYRPNNAVVLVGRTSFPTRPETLDELENSSYVLVMTPGAHVVRIQQAAKVGALRPGTGTSGVEATQRLCTARIGSGPAAKLWKNERPKLSKNAPAVAGS